MTKPLSYFVNPSQIIFEKFENEIVLINLNTGNYYSITGIAVIIWDLVEQGSDLMTILSELEANFDVGSKKIDDDIKSFLNDLIKEKLIESKIPEKTDSTHKNKSIDRQAKAEKKPYNPPKLESYTDMQDLILLDPIHEVDDSGWPNEKKEEKISKE